jgi:hypothetical protein
MLHCSLKKTYEQWSHHVNSGAMLHCSLKKPHELFMGFLITRSSKELLIVTCGCATVNGGTH